MEPEVPATLKLEQKHQLLSYLTNMNIFAQQLWCVQREIICDRETNDIIIDCF